MYSTYEILANTSCQSAVHARCGIAGMQAPTEYFKRSLINYTNVCESECVATNKEVKSIHIYLNFRFGIFFYQPWQFFEVYDQAINLGRVFCFVSFCTIC